MVLHGRFLSLWSDLFGDKKVKPDLRGQSWLVLQSLLEAVQKFHEQRKKEERRGGRENRKKEDKLKNREKW